jgi:hypothetical protein
MCRKDYSNIAEQFPNIARIIPTNAQGFVRIFLNNAQGIDEYSQDMSNEFKIYCPIPQ